MVREALISWPNTFIGRESNMTGTRSSSFEG